MRQIRVHRERRTAQPLPQHQERRMPCWLIENCPQERRALCHAHIVQENCWDFWAASNPRHKECCHKLPNCGECPIAQRKFPEIVPVFVRGKPGGLLRKPEPAGREPVPVCQHLHFLKGTLPSHFDLRRVLRETCPDDPDAFRCRLRGVYLDNSYVSDICSGRNARDCVFLP